MGHRFYRNDGKLFQWRLLVLTLLFATMWTMGARAQTTVTIGTGTSTVSTVPIYGLYGYSYSQILYTATDITGGGWAGGAASAGRDRFSNPGARGLAAEHTRDGGSNGGEGSVAILHRCLGFSEIEAQQDRFALGRPDCHDIVHRAACAAAGLIPNAPGFRQTGADLSVPRSIGDQPERQLGLAGGGKGGAEQ